MIGDTIFAVASPPGSGPRAVMRLSGPLARRAAAAVFAPALPVERAQVEGFVRVGRFQVEAFALHMPSPRSYTGEDVVELHVPGSPLLCSVLGDAMVAAIGGELRPARPGEFTARACQNGRLDMLQAEGVLMLIHGADTEAIAAGVSWLRGGLSSAIASVRGTLQDALALIEVGLDFEPGDTGAVDDAAWRGLLQVAQDELAALVRQLPAATSGGELLLLGRSNAGKSSLCNALVGRPALVVDAGKGTTRDVLRVELAPSVAVLDAPGDLDEPSAIDRAALELRDRLGAIAGGALLVVDLAEKPPPFTVAPQLPVQALVLTKCDRDRTSFDGSSHASILVELSLPPSLPVFATSAHSGAGIDALRAFLLQHSRSGARAAGAPVRHGLDAAAKALAHALAAPAPELCSQDLQETLRALDTIDGSHGVDDLLDRIYGRFCLGK